MVGLIIGKGKGEKVEVGVGGRVKEVKGQEGTGERRRREKGSEEFPFLKDIRVKRKESTA